MHGEVLIIIQYLYHFSEIIKNAMYEAIVFLKKI